MKTMMAEREPAVMDAAGKNMGGSKSTTMETRPNANSATTERAAAAVKCGSTMKRTTSAMEPTASAVESTTATMEAAASTMAAATSAVASAASTTAMASNFDCHSASSRVSGGQRSSTNQGQSIGAM